VRSRNAAAKYEEQVMGHTMSAVMKCLAVACVELLAAFPVMASDTVKVNPVVSYADASVGSAEVRSECEWNRRLVDYLVEYSGGEVEVVNEDLTKVPGRTLTLVATAVHTAGGSAFSGPKWARIRGELRQNGTVIGAFTVGANSAADVIRWSGCGVLNKLGKKLAKYTANWLKRPINGAYVGDKEGQMEEPAAGTKPTTPEDQQAK
jgi:hypothetical protein